MIVPQLLQQQNNSFYTMSEVFAQNSSQTDNWRHEIMHNSSSYVRILMYVKTSFQIYKISKIFEWSLNVTLKEFSNIIRLGHIQALRYAIHNCANCCMIHMTRQKMSAYRGECFKITFEGYTRLIKISGARHLLPSAGTHYGNLLGSVLDGQKVGGGGRSQVPNGGGTAQHQKLQEQTSFGEGSSEGLKKLILHLQTRRSWIRDNYFTTNHLKVRIWGISSISRTSRTSRESMYNKLTWYTLYYETIPANTLGREGEEIQNWKTRAHLETIVSVGVVVTVQVPVPGGVVDLTQVEVHALLTVFGTDNSNPAQWRIASVLIT